MPRYRGVDYVTYLPRKVKLEAVVGDAEAMPTVQAILRVSRISSSTDETISIGPLEQVVSIGISKPDCYPPRRFVN
jgi:nitrogen regulatory protein PII